MGLCNSVPKGAHGDAFYMPPGAFEDEPTTPAIPHASSKMGPRNPANVSKAQPVIPNVVPDERPLEDQTPLLKKKTPQTSSQVLASSEARDVAMPLPAASKAPKPPKVPQTAPLPGHGELFWVFYDCLTLEWWNANYLCCFLLQSCEMLGWKGDSSWISPLFLISVPPQHTLETLTTFL